MWRKTIGAMAAIVLVAGLAAHADDEQADREAAEREQIADREAAERERIADREAAEREKRGDQEAGERERRRDREAGEAERRRDREAGERPGRRGDEGERDAGPRRPPQPPRGPAPGDDTMPGRPGGRMRGMMPGGGMMQGMPGMQGMRGMMPGMGMPGMGMPVDDDRLRENDPEMFEMEQNDRRLERESQELAEQYRRAPEGPAREEIRGKLRDTVARHFKARQQRRELEVKRIEAQLDRLRGALERRSKEADAIIERRMSQMLGEADADF